MNSLTQIQTPNLTRTSEIFCFIRKGLWCPGGLLVSTRLVLILKRSQRGNKNMYTRTRSNAVCLPAIYLATQFIVTFQQPVSYPSFFRNCIFWLTCYILFVQSVYNRKCKSVCGFKRNYVMKLLSSNSQMQCLCSVWLY